MPYLWLPEDGIDPMLFATRQVFEESLNLSYQNMPTKPEMVYSGILYHVFCDGKMIGRLIPLPIYDVPNHL